MDTYVLDADLCIFFLNTEEVHYCVPSSKGLGEIKKIMVMNSEALRNVNVTCQQSLLGDKLYVL